MKDLFEEKSITLGKKIGSKVQIQTHAFWDMNICITLKQSAPHCAYVHYFQCMPVHFFVLNKFCKNVPRKILCLKSLMLEFR